MLDRFEGFPVNVGLLSRFRTKKQQTETIEQVKKGQIDILVGTHRLLSKDVEFADLGLLVIDEEQRFWRQTQRALGNNYARKSMFLH